MNKNQFTKATFRRLSALVLAVLVFLSSTLPTSSQIRIVGPGKGSNTKTEKKAPATKKPNNQNDDIVGERMTAEVGAEFTTKEIMEREAARGDAKTPSQIMAERGLRPKKTRPDRRNLPDGPGGSMFYSQYPYPEGFRNGDLISNLIPEAPQTLGIQFNGATGPAETGSFPPDTTGAAGPTQYFVFLNGRLRTFNKTTGVADGVVNVSSDTFFASVMTPPIAGEIVISTDPNIRFDRTSNRWFLNMIDAPLVAATGAISRVNRIMIAVSDAASNGTISGATVWTLYQFTGDATLFSDYQSMGIDSSAMYVGANMFTTAGAFNSTKGWVVRKAEMLTATPLVVTAFSGLVATPTGAGPFSPRGVDNTQATATTEGYFVGVDNATFNTLMLRRVTNPGSATPTMSANISIATPLTTRFPVLVPHLGNTGGTGGRLDALDDRLYLAVIRNNRLWTSQNIGVNNTGVAGATNNRNAARWYELQNIASPGTPSVLQSGTLFDNNATNDANQRNYWIPSIMVSGQGHAALGSSIAGTNERINAFTTGRLVGDTLGTLRDGPGGGALPGYTASSTAYNPPGDPGGPSRRWGDYSNTSLDPKDDMTMWTIQEYCNGTNTYSVRIAQLIAPPPANIANGPSGGIYLVPTNVASFNLTIDGTSVSGSGFYDPGANPPAPHTTFNHIAASVTNPVVTVNSVTYNSPTQIVLNLNTVGAPTGLRHLTITNPDGQFITRNNIINIVNPTAAPANISGRVTDAFGRGISGVLVRIQDSSGEFGRLARTNSFGYYTFPDVPTGESYVIVPSHKRFVFDPPSIVYQHVDEIGNLDFSGQMPK